MPNADFCHIIVDEGMLDDHAPGSVQKAVERLYQQISAKVTKWDNTTLDTKSDINKNDPSLQYHRSSTEPNQLEDVCILGPEPGDTTKVEVNEDTIKTPDVNENTTDVIVHIAPEDRNDD